MSVKVAVRLRPFNEREIKMGAKCCVEMNKQQTIIRNLSEMSESNKNKPTEHIFSFDNSFWSFDGFENDENGYSKPVGSNSPYVDQQHVYNLLGKEVLDNAWQGYHCCLFAYG